MVKIEEAPRGWEKLFKIWNLIITEMILSVISVNSSKITFRETNTKANSSMTSLTEITYFINQEID